MDWFEKLTGFRETAYDDTRTKIKVDERRLQSLVNGKSYGIGELELVSTRYPAGGRRVASSWSYSNVKDGRHCKH